MIKKLAHYLIRPQRAKYTESDLGQSEFEHKGNDFTRSDYQVKNMNGIELACSVFEPKYRKHGLKYDAIVYCHGNSGNKCAILECRDMILDHGFIAVCFDFSGCGNSTGKYVSLGHYEKYDIQAIIEFVRGLGYIDQIGLWGRSMGAVSTLMYCEIDQNIAAICLDSPFRCLESLIRDFMNKYKIISALFGGILYTRVAKYLLQEANLKIEDVKPIEVAKKCRIDAIFVHAIADRIIHNSHSDDIVKEYKGRKKYYNVSGGHNDLRNSKLYQEILNFFTISFNKHRQSETSTQPPQFDEISQHSEDSEPVLFCIDPAEKPKQRHSKRRALFYSAPQCKAGESEENEFDFCDFNADQTKNKHHNHNHNHNHNHDKEGMLTFSKQQQEYEDDCITEINEVNYSANQNGRKSVHKQNYEEEQQHSDDENAVQPRCGFANRRQKFGIKKQTITFHNFVEISSQSSSNPSIRDSDVDSDGEDDDAAKMPSTTNSSNNNSQTAICSETNERQKIDRRKPRSEQMIIQENTSKHAQSSENYDPDMCSPLYEDSSEEMSPSNNTNSLFSRTKHNQMLPSNSRTHNHNHSNNNNNI